MSLGDVATVDGSEILREKPFEGMVVFTYYQQGLLTSQLASRISSINSIKVGVLWPWNLWNLLIYIPAAQNTCEYIIYLNMSF